MVTSNAHKALFGCNHLGCIAMMPITLHIALTFFAPCDDVLTMLVCATHWFYMHLYMLVYMFMHESCLLVCRPCFNTMKLWTFNANLHLSLTDTTFCFFSCLFAFSLVCLLSCYAFHVYHAYLFYAFSYTFCTFSFHYFSIGFLSLPLHEHTWNEDAWS